jgi:hypothetical protein
MPLSPRQAEKRSKNRFALAVILLVVAGLYYLTILKISGH